MKAIDRGTLLTLADRSAWPSVSLYLPVDRTGTRTDADRTRLRNLVKQASDRLVHDGLKASGTEAMLAGVLALANDATLWTGGASGLALFVTPQTTEPHWLDFDMPELVVVGDRFYLRPIYTAFVGEAKAWALAIDSNKTRLFHLDPTSIEEVALPEGTPLSLDDTSRYDQREESLQFHTVPGGGTQGKHGGGAAMFHGQGGEKDYDKIARERFMADLGRGVVEKIGAQSAEPLVLLGVEYMVNEFRAAAPYSHIATEQITGATDYMTAADVLREVTAVLAPAMKAEGLAAYEEFKELGGTGRTSDDAALIVAAAAAGRVKTLIMDDSSGPWGWFDRKTFDVTHLCELEPRFLREANDMPEERDMFECGWDLIDLAAAETVRHNGKVLAYRGEMSPVFGAVAVFRY